ncbi:MAG: hypothetical protein R2755_17480 [Acidimicrobiales bacterium]
MLELQGAAHALGQAPGQRQAHAGALDVALLLAQPVEGQEQARPHGGIDAVTLVAHPQLHGAVLGRARHADRTARSVVLDGVAQQVEQHLQQPLAVGGGEALRWHRADVDAHAGPFGERRGEAHRGGQCVAHLDRLDREVDRARLDPGDVEDLVDQVEQVAAGPDDVLGGLLLVGGERLELQQLPEAQDGVERGAQLVAHPPEEVALQAVELPQTFVRLLEQQTALVQPFLDGGGDLQARPAGHAGRGVGHRVGHGVGHGVGGSPVSRGADRWRGTAAQPDQLGHVVHLVDDGHHRALLGQHRHVARAPVPGLEAAALLGRPAHVVALDRHHVGGAAVADAVQRCGQVAHAGGVAVVGVVGEHLEQVPAHDVGPAGHGDGEVAVGGVEDAQVGRQQQVVARALAEHGGHVRRGGRPSSVAAGGGHRGEALQRVQRGGFHPERQRVERWAAQQVALPVAHAHGAQRGQLLRTFDALGHHQRRSPRRRRPSR